MSLKSKSGPTLLAADNGDSSRFIGIFLASSLYCSQTLIHARPVAAKACRWATPFGKVSLQNMVNNGSTFRVYVHWLMQLILSTVWLPAVFLSVSLAKKMISSPSLSTLVGMTLILVVGWFFAALALSTVEVSDEKIRVKVPYGTYSMKWNEVEKIVTNGGLFALQNQDKTLSVSMVMAGVNKRRFYEFLNAQIEARKIAVEQSAQVPTLHQNTRE